MSQLFLPLLYREEKAVLPDESHAVMQRFNMLLSLLTLFEKRKKNEEKENMKRNRDGRILLRQHLHHMW